MTVVPASGDDPLASPAVEALIIADDLTGAADSAVGFTAGGLATRVVFAGSPAGVDTGGRPAALAFDTDSRRLGPRAAARAVADVAATAPGARWRMKKIDSTLRGNVGAETGAALDALGCRLAVCAPAFPGADRQTRDGIQWASGSPVGDVAACFADLATAHISVPAVRAGEADAMLEQAARDGARVVVVDAVTDEDLQQVVALGMRRDRAGGELLWIGSGGLSAALARATGRGRPQPPREPDDPPVVDGPALVVVGSATPLAAAQADQVAAAGAVEVSVPAGALLDRDRSADSCGAAVAAALTRGDDVVVRISEGGRIVPGHGREVVEALAAAVVPAVRHAPPATLVATGGETALAFARALGGSGLDVVAELEPGVVCSRMCGGAGLSVVTKAGAFGDPASLVRALGILRNQTTSTA